MSPIDTPLPLSSPPAASSGFAGGRSAQVTKEAVASKLAEFTDDELAALGLSRKKGRK